MTNACVQIGKICVGVCVWVRTLCSLIVHVLSNNYGARNRWIRSQMSVAIHMHYTAKMHTKIVFDVERGREWLIGLNNNNYALTKMKSYFFSPLYFPLSFSVTQPLTSLCPWRGNRTVQWTSIRHAYSILCDFLKTNLSSLLSIM